jgi:1-phosphofructokinase family hexose kinase
MAGTVLTVTLNPMIDKTVMVDAFRRGTITRGSAVSIVVGGKGINVSRQLRLLGVETLALGFAGGETGSLMRRLLDAEGIPHAFIDAGGMTREGLTYREADGTATSFFEPQHDVSEAANRLLVALVTEHMKDADWVVCSGGSPCRTTDATFADIIAAARAQGKPVVLDTYGAAFLAGLRKLPTLIKPNKQEYEETFGTRLSGIQDMVQAAKEIVRDGPAACIISNGGAHGVAVLGEQAYVFEPPAVQPVNPTGSGDTFIAAFLSASLKGWPAVETLAFAVAAATLNAAMWDVASVSPEAIAEMVPRVVLKPA